MSDDQGKEDTEGDHPRNETKTSSSSISPPRNVLPSPADRTLDVSSSPTGGFLFSGMAATPPQFVSLEQIMSAAKGVTNMVLCHEIAVNQDFVLKKAELKEKGLERQVKDIVEKAFWDLLSEELGEDPPRYDQAMVLLNDIKEGLRSFLLPQHTRLTTQIEEVLDIDLIRQQAEHGTLDVQHYAAFIISMMGRLCAPVRDQRIKELSEIQEVGLLFKGILEVMDLMKLDMANFTIQQFRPKIQQHSIEYERIKFQEFLKSQSVMFPQLDGLEFTRKWLRRHHTNLSSSPDADSAAAGGKSTNNLTKTLSKAYLELIEWDDDQAFPETLVIDQGRFHELGQRFHLNSLAGTVLLVTLSLAGPDLQMIASFKEQLKKSIFLILQDHVQQLHSPSVLEEQLRNVSEQVFKEVKECLQERGFPALTPEKTTALKEQVLAVASPNHKVRELVRGRMLAFLTDVISSNTASPIRVPPGLSSLQNELSSLAGQFLRLVDHNKAVFLDFYKDILDAFDKDSTPSET